LGDPIHPLGCFWAAREGQRNENRAGIVRKSEPSLNGVRVGKKRRKAQGHEDFVETFSRYNILKD